MFFGKKNVQQTKDFIDETKKTKVMYMFVSMNGCNPKALSQNQYVWFGNGPIKVSSVYSSSTLPTNVYNISCVILCLIDYSKLMKINQLCSPLRNVGKLVPPLRSVMLFAVYSMFLIS